MAKDGEHDHVHSTHSHTWGGERLSGEIQEGTNNKIYTSKRYCHCSIFSDYVPSISRSLSLNSPMY